MHSKHRTSIELSTSLEKSIDDIKEKFIHKEHRSETMKFIITAGSILFINIGYIHILLTRKRNIKYTLSILAINILVSLIGSLLFYIFLKNTVIFDYITSILGFTFIVYIHLVFKESISEKIFTMFTIWLFSNVLLVICSYIIYLFFIKDFNLYRSYSIVLRDFIQIVFLFIIYLYFQTPYREMLKLVSNKVINIISLYSIIIFLFLIKNYDITIYKTFNNYKTFNSLLFILIIILSYIIIFIAISSVNRNIELEYKFKIIDTQVELQKQNYINLNKSIQNYYEFKHDIRHHFLAIKSMMDAKNYIAASEYFDKLYENEICQNIGVLCKNFTIDSILKHYISIAMKYNIDFKVNVNISQDISIDNLDLSIVIGNCVENAIEACNNIVDKSKKYINIKTEIIGSQLVIKIKNSFNGQVKKEGGIIITSKNGDGHGIGLSNVRKISKKYNGYFNIKYNDNEFEVGIVMNFDLGIK
jgi:two-component system, LytTR family, sensor histidine kinase AgrC